VLIRYAMRLHNPVPHASSRFETTFHRAHTNLLIYILLLLIARMRSLFFRLLFLPLCRTQLLSHVHTCECMCCCLFVCVCVRKTEGECTCKRECVCGSVSKCVETVCVVRVCARACVLTETGESKFTRQNACCGAVFPVCGRPHSYHSSVGMYQCYLLVVYAQRDICKYNFRRQCFCNHAPTLEGPTAQL